MVEMIWLRLARKTGGRSSCDRECWRVRYEHVQWKIQVFPYPRGETTYFSFSYYILKTRTAVSAYFQWDSLINRMVLVRIGERVLNCQRRLEASFASQSISPLLLDMEGLYEGTQSQVHPKSMKVRTSFISRREITIKGTESIDVSTTAEIAPPYLHNVEVMILVLQHEVGKPSLIMDNGNNLFIQKCWKPGWSETIYVAIIL